MIEAPTRDSALDYFYFGFYRTLRRFRTATIAGWCLAGAGAAAIALRWDPVWRGDLVGGILCGLLIVAGVFLVQQALAELSSYTGIAFPGPPATEENREICDIVDALSRVMEEVEGGGWQDALRALSSLREIGERYGLPRPDGTPQ